MIRTDTDPWGVQISHKREKIKCQINSRFLTVVVGVDLVLDLAGMATGGRALAREDAVGAIRLDVADAFPVALLVRGFVTGVFDRTFVSV